jgi:iron complex outermembrane receptor protein
MFDKRYNVFNPSIGMNYDLKNNQYLFMNFSTSFETPTMSELSVNPAGDEGFNTNLNPSKSQNYEAGWKLYKPKFLFEATAFYINSTNEVLPYELEEFPGRSFYKNAGSNLRRGFEVFAQLNWKVFKFTGSYNFAKYTFKHNEDNQESKLLSLPGIPKSHLYLNIEYINQNNWITRLTFENIGGLYANSSNTVYVNSFQKTSFQIGKSFVLNTFNIELLGGINNILNYEYFDNIRLNAFGSRFYEPAPPRNIYTGISLNF